MFDAQRVWRASLGEIQEVVTSYFSSMLYTIGSGLSEEILDSIQSRVTSEMNDLLLVDYSDSEIKDALFQMNPHTALRLDGMSLLFFQRFWPILGHDVVCVVKFFLSTGRILKQVNYTLISVIPKVAEP